MTRVARRIAAGDGIMPAAISAMLTELHPDPDSRLFGRADRCTAFST
ncbi:MAG: hypothetical protein MZW92_29095 [Comamonadaceae bacterium]|nr:hypothetical protein [Comamonadaceae bacterium]